MKIKQNHTILRGASWALPQPDLTLDKGGFSLRVEFLGRCSWHLMTSQWYHCICIYTCAINIPPSSLHQSPSGSPKGSLIRPKEAFGYCIPPTWLAFLIWQCHPIISNSFIFTPRMDPNGTHTHTDNYYIYIHPQNGAYTLCRTLEFEPEGIHLSTKGGAILKHHGFVAISTSNDRSKPLRGHRFRPQWPCPGSHRRSAGKEWKLSVKIEDIVYTLYTVTVWYYDILCIVTFRNSTLLKNNQYISKRQENRTLCLPIAAVYCVVAQLAEACWGNVMTFPGRIDSFGDLLPLSD